MFSSDGLRRTIDSSSRFVDWYDADYYAGRLKFTPAKIFCNLTNSIEFEASSDAAQALIQILVAVMLKACSDSFNKITSCYGCTFGDHW